MTRLVSEHFKRDGRPKRAYATRADAERAASAHDTIYRCGFCGAYHRATSRKAPRRRYPDHDR